MLPQLVFEIPVENFRDQLDFGCDMLQFGMEGIVPKENESKVLRSI